MNEFSRINNYVFPTEFNAQPRKVQSTAMSRYIAPVRLERIKQDIGTWRDAVYEAELAFWPHRVKMQRMYQDAVVNGHISSAMDRRKNLTLLKDFQLCDKSGKENEELTDWLRDQEWFYLLMSYCLDAKFFGYSLIGLGDIIGDTLPNLEIIRRANVSPDREQLVPYVYSLSGVNFNDPASKDENGQSFYDWSIYVKTPSDVGTSKCGFGLLYKLSFYEIGIRNNLSWNTDFVEMFAQPYRHAKSTKTEGPERDMLEMAMQNMGSAGYIITDPTDEIAFLDGSSKGRGYDSYDNLESRHVKAISKLTFGHADAMDSIAGKLGNQGTDDDSVGKAIREVEKTDNRFFTFLANGQILPKLRNLGFRIPEGVRFKFKNDKEEQEEKNKKEDSNNKFVMNVKTLSDAGFEVDPKFIEQETGYPVVKKEPEPMPGLSPKIKNTLNKIYAK